MVKIPVSFRAALALRDLFRRIDARLLVAVVSLFSLVAWFAPSQVLFGCAALAALIAFTALNTMPGSRSALTAYALFALFWSVSQLMLYLFDNPGHFATALELAALLGLRLLTLLGFAMLVPLSVSSLTLGRVLTWYLGWLSWLEAQLFRLPFLRGRKRFLAEGVWRASLALALMMAFFPRAMRTLSDLRQSLALRAPRLPVRKRLVFLGISVLRVLSMQTWDMTLAIASRNLYRPAPWVWRSAAP